MAILEQGDAYKTVVGWHGDCEADECQDIELSVYKQYISAVFQWDNDGILKVWKASLPDVLNKAFKKLECGKLYYIRLKPGVSSFTIPGFVLSTHETVDAGRLASSCQATPTPIFCVCAPDNFKTLTSLSTAAFVDSGHTFGGFAAGTEISYDPSTLAPDAASAVTLNFPNGVSAGTVMFSGKKPNGTQFFVKHGRTCYTATATASNVGPDGWTLPMAVSEQLPENCGDEKPLSTPTPEPDPTPTPVAPTPTPVPVDCTCAPSSYATLTSTGPSPFVSGGHTFGGFATGTEISYDPSTLAPDAASAVTLNFPNGVSAGTVMFSGKKPNGTQFFVKHGLGCYTATATASNVGPDGWTLTMTSSKTLSSTCGPDVDVPDPPAQPTPTPVPDTTAPTATISGAPTSAIYPDTNTSLTIGGTDVTHFKVLEANGQWSAEFPVTGTPSITGTYTIGTHVIKVVGRDAAGNWQTEANATTVTFQVIAVPATPTPEVPSECCPSSYTTVTLNGVINPESTFLHTYATGAQEPILGWQGFENGDKLCFDMTLVTGWTVNDTEAPNLVFMPENPSTPVGTVRKMLRNGSDRNTFYLIKANGDCYTEEYESSTSIVLKKTSGTAPVATPTPVDTTAPTATISGAPTSAIYPDTDIELTIGGTDVTHYKYWLTPDYENSSGQMGIVAKILKGPNDWTLGTHTVKVVGRDAAGNWQTEANATTVTFQVIATPTYALSSVSSVNEGGSFTVTLNTTGVSNGTEVAYQITGIESADISQTLSGNFIVGPVGAHNANAYKTFNVNADSATEGEQTFTLKLTNNQAQVSVVINDSSVGEATPTPAPDCCCSPDGFDKIASTSQIFFFQGHTFASFEVGVEIGYDKNTLETDLSTAVTLNYPDNSLAGVIMMTGKKPTSNTKFYVRRGRFCYSATASASAPQELTLSVQETLPEGCSDISAGEAIDCCTDKSTRLLVFNGTGETGGGISQIASHPSGLMDGELCFDSPDDYEWEFQTGHLISFEGKTDVNEQMMFQCNIKQADLDGVQFIYRLKDDECFMGYLTESGSSTFTLVE